jgi:hypothetical protein
MADLSAAAALVREMPILAIPGNQPCAGLDIDAFPAKLPVYNACVRHSHFLPFLSGKIISYFLEMYIVL